MRSVDDDYMLRDPRLIDVIDEHPDPVPAGSSASRRLKEVYIDGELETVDTTNWFPNWRQTALGRSSFTLGQRLAGILT